MPSSYPLDAGIVVNISVCQKLGDLQDPRKKSFSPVKLSLSPAALARRASIRASRIAKLTIRGLPSCSGQHRSQKRATEKQQAFPNAAFFASAPKASQSRNVRCHMLSGGKEREVS